MKTLTTSVAVALALLLAASANAALIGFNAEDGSSVTATVTATLGDAFDPPIEDVGNALGDKYITTEYDGGADYPGAPSKITSYAVTFAQAGTYDLYARVYIGPDANAPDPAGTDDDSMFYGNGFGSKGNHTANDWITVNGWADRDDTAIPIQQYTWINLTEDTGLWGEGGVTFTVPAGGLTQTFQIGAGETGLRIDALAFGTSTDTFTAAQLSAAVVPEPATLGLLAAGLALLRLKRASAGKR